MARDGNTRPFKVSKAGLYHRCDAGLERICDYIHVYALAHESGVWYSAIQFRDRDNRLRKILVREDERMDPRRLTEKLAAHGFAVPAEPTARKRLAEYISTASPRRRDMIARSPGWRQGSYVLPGKTYGPNRRCIIYPRDGDSSTSDRPQTKGSLKSWQRDIAKLAAFSGRMRFVIAAAFAAPLLHVRKRESFSIVLHGDTSLGKTTAEIAARTVVGPASRGKLPTWDMTWARLDEIAAQHCDQLLVIDDMELLDVHERMAAQKVTRFLYQIASQTEKGRSKRYFDNSPDLEWRVIVLTSSEKSLAARARDARWKRKAGEQMRVIDLPADAGQGLGIFDRLPKTASSADALSKTIEQACLDNFGTPIRAFIEFVIGCDDHLLSSRLDKYEAAFRKAIGFDDSDPATTRRYVEKFSLIYAAGCIAIDAKVLPWKKKNLLIACRSCYRAASKVPNATSTDDDCRQAVLGSVQALRALLADAAQNGGSVAGVQFRDNDRFAAVLPELVDSVLIAPASRPQVCQWLDRSGFLVRGSDGKLTRQVRVNGERQRHICIRESFWQQVTIPVERGRTSHRFRQDSLAPPTPTRS